jgi:hypothetical protein
MHRAIIAPNGGRDNRRADERLKKLAVEVR